MPERPRKPRRSRKQRHDDIEFAKKFAATVLRKIGKVPDQDPLEVTGSMLRDISEEMPSMSHSQVALLFFQGIWHGAYVDVERG